jgi:hypothetical protein
LEVDDGRAGQQAALLGHQVAVVRGDADVPPSACTAVDARGKLVWSWFTPPWKATGCVGAQVWSVRDVPGPEEVLLDEAVEPRPAGVGLGALRAQDGIRDQVDPRA